MEHCVIDLRLIEHRLTFDEHKDSGKWAVALRRPWYVSSQVRSKIASILKKPDTRWVLIIAGVLGVLYSSTLCTTVYWYDSAEFAACAHRLGVPHPPGYPLYMLIAHVFTHLPGEPALGVNIMSLVFGIVSVLLCFVLGRQMSVKAPAAAAAALTLGVGKTFWWNSIVAEVYTIGLSFTLGVLVLLMHAVRCRSPRLIVVAALLGGLGVGVHMSLTTFGVGYLVLVASVSDPVDSPRDLLTLWTRGWRSRLRVLASSTMATAMGLLVFLYIPLREFVRWDAREWKLFFANVTGGRFKARFMEGYDLAEQLGLLSRSFTDNLTVMGLGLAALGLVLVWRRNPRGATALGLAIAGNVWFFFNYYVHDIEVFYLPAIAVTAVLIGAGLDGLGDALIRRRIPQVVAVGAMFVLPTGLALRHYDHCDLSEATEARDYAQQLIHRMPHGAEIVLYEHPAEWKRFAVLQYVREALGQRHDVVLSRRPAIAIIEARAAAHEPLYALMSLKRLIERPTLTMVQDGVLWKILHVDLDSSPE